jgi:hypothetical protein
MITKFIAVVATIVAATGAAHATEIERNGVLYSNVCTAPSGDVWVYPMYAAQPVGSDCRIFSTGEFGTVGG